MQETATPTKEKEEQAAPAIGAEQTSGQTSGASDRRRQSAARRGRTSRRGERTRSEFDQKIVSIRRVTRVVAGGRRFSFSVGIVIGDRKGKVGVGSGKASDTALAIEKAVRDAKNNMITVPLTDEQSIEHMVSTKYCASQIEIRPAPGRGLIAGGAVRPVLELAGIKDVSSKIFSRSKNHVNNARGAIEALKQLRPTKKTATASR